MKYLVVKYIVLFLISWWCFGCVLQAVTLIERVVARQFLSYDLTEACLYWSTVKNIFEEGLLVIRVSIKSDRQPNISKPLSSCWTMHIPSKTLAQFCGTELSSSFPPEDSVTLISQTWKYSLQVWQKTKQWDQGSTEAIPRH